jgi:hypothetical protein
MKCIERSGEELKKPNPKNLSINHNSKGRVTISGELSDKLHTKSGNILEVETKEYDECNNKLVKHQFMKYLTKHLGPFYDNQLEGDVVNSY